MRFCPECGAQLIAGAKFCVECGQRLEAATQQPQRPVRNRIPPAAVAVFGGIVVIGLALALVVGSPTRPPENAATNGSAPSAVADGRDLPPGHPKMQLPAEAIKLIAEVESNANAKPNDLSAWNELGDVGLRAAMFDPSYYAKAMAAYGHVLKIDPDNLDALRGVGNVDFDRHNYDQAIAAYEHYLTQKPDDPEVRTDLGTMYLYTGNADQAEVQYRRAIATKPNFFEGYFNLGIAYGQQNNDPEAKAAFEKALQLAPDDKARERVKQMIVKVEGAAGGSAGGQTARTSGAGAGAATVKEDTFRDSVEQLIRGVPFAGPKVKSIQWPSSSKAIVLMDNFPMEQMPPFAKQKFIRDLTSGIDSAKAAHEVTGPVELDIADAATGQVMETVRR
jgi:tetratricopeptide (TPR) repeat protein